MPHCWMRLPSPVGGHFQLFLESGEPKSGCGRGRNSTGGRQCRPSRTAGPGGCQVHRSQLRRLRRSPVFRINARPAEWSRSMACTLDLFRNERNFRTRHPKTAQVAVNRAWREAQHANVSQRDDLAWIWSLPATRHVSLIHWNKARKIQPARSVRVNCCVCCLIMKQGEFPTCPRRR